MAVIKQDRPKTFLVCITLYKYGLHLYGEKFVVFGNDLVNNEWYVQ